MAAAAVASAVVGLAGCGGKGRSAFDSVMAPQGDLDYEMYAREYVSLDSGGKRNERHEGADGSGERIPAEVVIAPVPEEPCSNARIRVYNVGHLRDVFNDSNKYQYAVAERLGIKPITTLADAYFTRRPLVEVKSCDLYEIDSLTHSLPFLVPEAERLLARIGKNFIDSLRRRGGDGYRIRVTSLLRTPASVKRLRRVNRNATDSSTHQFGTTFDLTYTRFYCLDSTRTIHDGDLKNLLAEVLCDLRRQGKCMVKFERHTACFHITATGK